MDFLEQHFIKGCSESKYPADILNWYRNLYYKEDEGTERAIVAKAINDLFMEMSDKGILDYLSTIKIK